MRILVISQVVFSKTNNTGKTLSSYFQGFKTEEISQLYFHSEIPTDGTICDNYFRFTDFDAIKSILNRRIKGNSYTINDIKTELENARVDTGIKRKLYIIGSKHTPVILTIRDIIWTLCNLRNMKLYKWIEDYNPEVIFFLSGDAGFTYDIARHISEKYSIPLIPMCVDDYYINNRNEGRLFSNIQHKFFMRKVFRCFEKAPMILTICDKMSKEYKCLFNKECNTLHTSAVNGMYNESINGKQISYIGNIGYERYVQLMEIGKALSEIKIEGIPRSIDVYSGSIENEYIDKLKKAKGVSFHGEIPSYEVQKIMHKSIAVIHTESFSKRYRAITRYSVSTKIADSLMQGPCIIAYGPSEIASIQYLKDNNAAYVITEKDDLKRGLTEVLTNKHLREELTNNARKLATTNHDKTINSKKIREWLESAIDNKYSND